MLNTPKTAQQTTLLHALGTSYSPMYYIGIFFVLVFSILMISPSSAMAWTADYYSDDTSADYYGGSGGSADYYGSNTGADYYGGNTGADYYGNGSLADYYGGSSPSSASGDYYFDTYTPSYYPSYDNYGGCSSCGYSSPSYGYGGYSAPVYSYAPQASYQYIPYNTSGAGNGYRGNTGGSGSGVQYVSSSNTNANSNENTNAITNTFNPTNNNDARINLIVYGGGTANNSNPHPVQNYQAYAPTTYGSNYVNNTSYPTYPTPTYVSYASQNPGTNLGTPVSGVFLSQVPETGVGFGIKMTLFSLGLTLWSIFAAFMIARKKNGALANKINAFKLANMQKKGIQG